MIKTTKKNITLLATMLMGPISLSLIVISVYLIQPKVEAKLTSNVKSVLQQNNILADISFSGRDGVLKGEVASQEISEKAEKLSLSVFGTRTIRNQLNVKDTAKISPEILDTLPIIEGHATLTPHKKIKENKSLEVATTVVETEKNQLSDIDKIMENMQKRALLKPKYEAPILIERKPIETHNIQLVSLNTAEKIPESIEIIKADNLKKHTKKIATIALSSEITNTDQVDKKIIEKNNEPTELLSIIEDFNAFLEPPSSKKNVATPSINIKRDNTITAKTLDNIDLSTIQFTAKSTHLSNESYATLDQVSQSIKAYYHAPIDLIIYANDSDIAYAQGVAIRDYLVKKGVSRSKISVSGHTITANKGKETPIIIKLRNE